jgi:hypothetical protein
VHERPRKLAAAPGAGATLEEVIELPTARVSAVDQPTRAESPGVPKMDPACREDQPILVQSDSERLT